MAVMDGAMIAFDWVADMLERRAARPDRRRISAAGPRTPTAWLLEKRTTASRSSTATAGGCSASSAKAGSALAGHDDAGAATWLRYVLELMVAMYPVWGDARRRLGRGVQLLLGLHAVDPAVPVLREDGAGHRPLSQAVLPQPRALVGRWPAPSTRARPRSATAAIAVGSPLATRPSSRSTSGGWPATPRSSSTAGAARASPPAARRPRRVHRQRERWRSPG